MDDKNANDDQYAKILALLAELKELARDTAVAELKGRALELGYLKKIEQDAEATRRLLEKQDKARRQDWDDEPYADAEFYRNRKDNS